MTISSRGGRSCSGGHKRFPFFGVIVFVEGEVECIQFSSETDLFTDVYGLGAKTDRTESLLAGK